MPKKRTGHLVPLRRLRAHGVDLSIATTPADVVRHLVAMQSQDYAGSRWAVGVRLPPGTTDSVVARALRDGSILRTHAMRWTWQLVSADDVRWLLDLLGPKLIRRAAKHFRDVGLDDAKLKKSCTVLARALRDGASLTREEVAACFARNGIETTGQRLSLLLGHAELCALITSGVPRGMKPTYVLLASRAPNARAPLPREEALAELARRYFTSRGPASEADFVWWTGLPVGDARIAIAGARASLETETVGEQIYFHAPATTASSIARAHLLPAFDEHLISYRDRSAMLEAHHVTEINAGGGMFRPIIVVDGRVVGRWKHTRSSRASAIDLHLFDRQPVSAERAIEKAADRFRTFVAG